MGHYDAARKALATNDLSIIEQVVQNETREGKSNILGAAVRSCTPDVVKFLIEDAVCGCVRNKDFVFYETITNGHGIIGNTIERCQVRFRLTGLQDADTETFAKNLAVLNEHAEQIGFSSDVAAICALVMGDEKVRQAFALAGMSELSPDWKARLSTKNRGYMESETARFCMSFPRYLFEEGLYACRCAEDADTARKDGIEYAEAIERLKKAAGGYLHFHHTRKILDRSLMAREVPAELIIAAADSTNLGKNYGRMDLLKMSIVFEMTDLLKLALEAGFAKTWKNYETLIEFAQTNGAGADMVAMLMDAQRKCGAKPPKQPGFRNPNSRSELLKAWTVRDLEDGTVEIVSYKGYGTTNIDTVRVPEKIGEKTVSRIAPDAFRVRTSKNNKIRMARQSVRELTIPGSVQSVEINIMDTDIEKVTLEEGCLAVAKRAFSSSSSLNTVTLPDNLQDVGPYAFSFCPNLADVRIAEGTTVHPLSFKCIPWVQNSPQSRAAQSTLDETPAI